MSPPDPAMSLIRFGKYVWSVLGYILLVVMWGAFVRASGSGDGCGNHWPLCNGSLLPMFGDAQQTIEFSHRISSGMVLPLVIGLIYGARKFFPAGHQARKAAYIAFGLTMLEALIGAALVKFGWVDQDDSAARAGVMGFHVVSTFLLVGSITALGLIVGGASKSLWRNQGPLGTAVLIGLLAICFLGISGAISALGHTLKPVDDVLQQALRPETHWMVRLQPLHPLIGASVGLYLLLVGGLLGHLRPHESVRKAVRIMLAIYGLQIVIGIVSIFLKAPIAMQMIHLALADVLFASFLACGWLAFGESVARVELTPPGTATDHEIPALEGWRKVGAYVVLTKPRVISLLLFTTLTAMFIAQGGWPGLGLFLVVAIGGYMSAGAANAINMVIDRDIDATMKRTAKRPTVTNAIPARNALLFGMGLAAASFLILWMGANLLTAVMALSGLVFYVIVYTLMLKRRTWHNIVIGGAAGAFPPLVGWAAVTNELNPLGWYLFAIIFVWTPVHFWALALMIKDDYAAAGVPMLPVVKGERTTVIQISLYTVLTILISALPLLQPHVGATYLIGMALLNLLLVVRTIQLYMDPQRPQALRLYKYSMAYLALLFLVLAFDRSFTF
ncbi:MAG TPA: heme o synthase [Fimbriimonadaceae bacterium]|nr:heme o synthase [Fimbriimonadaceae bacterium]